MTTSPAIDVDIDWDDAFANGPYIPGAAEYPARFKAAASAFRAQAGGMLDVPYGPDPRERMDLFAPAAATRGLFVFVHGGYWHLPFGKADWSHLAAGAVASGWSAAVLEYPLCPAARVSAITRSVAAAIAVAAARVAGPIVVAGHSAGGHLAARMACADAPLDPALRARLRRCAPISGVFDLRPLLATRMNAALGLDDAEAAAESPVLRAQATAVVAWVGEAERPEFHRQARCLTQAWPAATTHVAAGRHHFDVIDLLRDADGAMLRTMLAD
ncbi:MAG: alpha/beta hydrolase [Hyphomonadaceae bacterium]|nr:alpha/beta hydrolase [Hyphomonadaceae bacterium]